MANMKEVKVLHWKDKFDPKCINTSRMPGTSYYETYDMWIPDDPKKEKYDLGIRWEMQGGYENDEQLKELIGEFKRAFRENGCSGIIRMWLSSYMDPDPYEVYKFSVDGDDYKKVFERVAIEYNYEDEDED
jgi:hypothetical protein